MFPPSMLARLYVKGSLKNVPEGFEFTLNNTIDYATLSAAGPVIVDGKSYPAASIHIAIGDQEWHADQISYANPVSARMFVPIRITLEGEQLLPGEHLILITVNTREIGPVKFDVKDNLS